MRFLAKLFRRWPLYLLLVVALPTLVTLYGQQKLTVFETKALLFINKPSAMTGNASGVFNQYLSPAQNGANAMNEALQSETFVVSVAQKTGLASVYDLSSQAGQDAVTARLQQEVSIRPSGVGENTLFVYVDDKSPHLAQQICAALITQFKVYFAQSQLSLDQQTIAFLQQQLQEAQNVVQQDQARITQYLAAHPSLAPTGSTINDPSLASLQEQYNRDASLVNTLTSRLKTVQFDQAAAESGVSDVFIVQDAPRVPQRSTLSTKKLLVYTGGGLAAALALVTLIVGAQTLADRRVYSQQDLRIIAEDLELNIPVIEAVPVLQTLGRHSVADDDPGVYSGVLVPVLTTLPQLGTGQMTRELRKAIGLSVEEEAEA
jgi:uncharacterized protein involved in exopolysaccharide biosynthesis